MEELFMARLHLYIGISLLVLLVTMTLTGNYIIEERRTVVNQLSSNVEKQASTAAAIFVDREMQNKLELEYFADLSIVWKALSSGSYQSLDDVFLKLMRKKSSIVQVRLLDLQGKELYRIDDQANVPTRLPTAALQNKANRYYIKDLLNTATDKTYLSKIDLNIEHGVIEKPYRPVLRIGKKIVNKETGEILGSLLFNFDLNRIFANISASIPRQMEWYFIDQSGQFLANPDATLLYCTQLDCTASHDSKLYHPGVRNYYQEQLAAVVDIISYAGISGTNFQLLVKYKGDFLPLFTREKTTPMILFASYLWWTILFVTSVALSLFCLLYDRYQQQCTDKINREKMQSVLEGITDIFTSTHGDDGAMTNNHVQRVAAYSRLMAEHLNLDKQFINDIYQFSSLHNIGKISMSGSTLTHSEDLELDEWQMMKAQVDNGHKLLRDFDLSKVAENILLSHHERWDGKGYPKKVSGEEIPIEARIVSLVDCFDALMSKRPYKDALSFEKSKGIINDAKGKAFDPKLVELFNSLEGEFRTMLACNNA